MECDIIAVVNSSLSRFLGSDCVASVEVKLEEPMCAELYKTSKDLGRFALRAGEHTVAAGIITELLI